MSAEAPIRGRSTSVRGLLVFLATVVLGYSFLIATRPLSGIFSVVLLYLAYLAWQFLGTARRAVGALERIADSMERRDDLLGHRTSAGDIEGERKIEREQEL